ncbi:glutathione S-transferase [Pantoea sp. A4]|uniref:glutathione S-transferase n=1 Tax=Pantoea sp. A4 TaxID=1225184 RepID=UPI00036E640F|nr:glutathione S-transferase [Pantoea sp. A4]
MKLIGSYTSPFVRKISVMLLEKGIIFEFVNESPWLEESEVPRYNPLGKVPALVDDNGQCWFDSAIIADYLELQHTPPAFSPADPLKALQVRQLAKLADGITDAAVLIVREQQRPGNQQSEALLIRCRGHILRGLDRLEQEARDGQWLHGDTLNLADIATGCMLGYLNFRRIVPDWCVERPALVKLAEDLFQRASFARTVPAC